MLAQSRVITTPIAEPDPDDRVCPKCGTRNESGALIRRQYRCAGCGLELAHLDMAANGAVRGVFGWVLDRGVVVHERYQIVAVLGKGGFGVTYLVDDIRLAGKRRALKEIPGLLFDEYETRLLGRLTHPAIPDIIDRFDADGMVYLVLEFGGSRTLRIEMDRQGGRLPVFVLLPWIEQVCAALVYLHSQDPPVIHRDLKPENILLDDNDRVMLIDFGIAKESNEQNATRTLGRAVTHGFSPPEQVLGTGTDVRSDVYALGAILYCAITGRVPPAAHERITGTVFEPPSRFFPEIPVLLDTAICQALELNLQKRQQSIAELAQCLALVCSGGASARTVVAARPAPLPSDTRASEAVRLDTVKFPSTRQSQRATAVASVREPPPAEPSPPPPRQAWKWVGIGFAGFALAGASGWLYWRNVNPDSRREPPKEIVSPARSVPPQAQTPEGPASPLSSGPASASLPPPTPAPVAAPVVTDTTGAGGPHAAPTQSLAPPAALPQEQPASAVGTPISGPGAPAQAVLPSAQPPPRPTRFAPDGLPSVFSSEQKPAGAADARPRESLMDEYEKYRAQQSQPATSAPQPPSAPTANMKPAMAKPTRSVKPTIPKAPARAARIQKPTTTSRAPQQAPPSSPFVVRDKGVRRTD